MSELQKVVSKVIPTCTYTTTANYWTPLADEYDDDDECQNNEAQLQQEHEISVKPEPYDSRSTIRAWIKQLIEKHKPHQKTASTMVIDSGATSSFVRPEENLPITGISNKVVHLPDGSTIQATHTTMLPFESLSTEAHKADVLPGL